MKKIKIIFYFTHKESLGHTTRILNIIRTLKDKYRKKLNIYVLQAGRFQRFLDIPKDISWFNLPYPYYSKLNFKIGATRNFIPLYAKIRANYMLSKIKGIKPDIFVTEFFPFGREECRFELLPVLMYLKKEKIKIFASIGYPYIVRNNLQILLLHCDFYDKFLIHTPEKIEFDYLRSDITNPLLKCMYQKTFDHINSKVIYTGYILPFRNEILTGYKGIRAKFKSKNKIFVVVSRGGGVIYPKIIASSILAKQYLQDKYCFLIVAGPSSSAKEMSLFKKLIAKSKDKNIYLYKYIPNFSAYLKASDISISMSGYNTSVQLLYFRKPSIVIPSRENPETAVGYCNEQISRASVLNRYIGSRILEYSTLTAKEIAQNIANINMNKAVGFSKGDNNWFMGAEITAKNIVDE